MRPQNRREVYSTPMKPIGRLTPDTRRWIIAQAEAGQSAEALFKALVGSGWTEDAALDALESTLRLKVAELESRAPAKKPDPGKP
jgi:prolyl 4-hydroxylase